MTERSKKPVIISIMTGNILLKAFEDGSHAEAGNCTASLASIAEIDVWSYFAGRVALLSFVMGAIDRHRQTDHILKSSDLLYHPFIGRLSDNGVNYVREKCGNSDTSPFSMGMLDMANYVARTLEIA
ncbi:hypothetical protein [Acetobacter persici]|uniref:Uncharacterized protein n=1 Tax=Acetobacter persici TaxID=1076596 RepID=A0A1U9LJR4_9PROT|nr:hypothetical protein [Acetobacter persici]AQT06661.1 hypothetical protein A0U91_16790 [Acetobacter persici]